MNPRGGRQFGIVLAGGRSRRMGTDKLALADGTATMLQRTCAAVAPHVERLVVAGPQRPAVTHVEFVTEEPRFGGPVAGLAAAVAVLPDDAEAQVMVLAGDLARPERVVAALLAAEVGTDGVVPVDSTGWRQYLSGRYRLASLRAAVAAAPRPRDAAVKRVLQGMELAEFDAPDVWLRDVDTPDDARQAGFFLPGSD